MGAAALVYVKEIQIHHVHSESGEDHKRPADKVECDIQDNKRYASEHSSEQPEKIRNAVAVILLLFLLQSFRFPSSVGSTIKAHLAGILKRFCILVSGSKRPEPFQMAVTLHRLFLPVP